MPKPSAARYAHSVAMSQAVHTELAQHLLRADGQEDICLATYAPSTGASRATRIIATVELPLEGEREVHRNATITGGYVLRVAAEAARTGRGVALLHSHPGVPGWQGLSGPDFDCESAYARLVQQLTGLPLVGMTLAGGDHTWSARVWIEGDPQWAASVRRVGPRMITSWCDDLVPALLDKRSRPAPSPRGESTPTATSPGSASSSSASAASASTSSNGWPPLACSRSASWTTTMSKS